MARTPNDGPVLKQWLQETPRKSARQYAVVLRPFLREIDPTAATIDDLLGFVLAQPSESTRRKACTALSGFFSDLFERGLIADDPSRRLAQRIRAQSGRGQRREALLTAGMNEGACDVARWSDVLLGLVASTAAGDRIALPDAPAVRELEDILLERLGNISRSRFASLMREPLA